MGEPADRQTVDNPGVNIEWDFVVTILQSDGG